MSAPISSTATSSSASPEAEKPTAHARVLVARIGAELVAFPLASVREVIDAPVVNALPLGPAALLGQLSLRDAHLPVLDAGTLLGIGHAASGAGVALVFPEGFALQLDDAHDVWDADAAAVSPVPAGTDRLGVLVALLRRGGDMASLVDTTALSARALATLREHSLV